MCTALGMINGAQSTAYGIITWYDGKLPSTCYCFWLTSSSYIYALKLNDFIKLSSCLMYTSLTKKTVENTLLHYATKCLPCLFRSLYIKVVIGRYF